MSSWISCQKIVANLWQCYTSVSEATSLHFGPEQKGQDLITLSQQIIDHKPNVISFIDHRPHPLDLLQYLIPMWIKEHGDFPEIIFHVYGDFTLNYHKWAALGSLIKGIKTKFCAASTAEQKLLEKLMLQKTHLVPFPVNQEEFSPDEDLRIKKRNELKVSDQQKVFIFTGRLSYQKNIHLLVEKFLSYVESKNSTDILLIFGHFDDLGDSFTDYRPVIGQYYHQVENILKDHPRREQIRFMGMASSQELKGYYNASDFLINLSTHNDEDFGMSVAEASLCGLASILTAWGGFHDFAFTSNKYLNVTTHPKKMIDFDQFQDHLTQSSNYDRGALAIAAAAQFSIGQGGATKLKVMLNSPSGPFKEYSSLFFQVQRSALYSQRPYLDIEHKLNSLYQELYESYLG